MSYISMMFIALFALLSLALGTLDVVTTLFVSVVSCMAVYVAMQKRTQVWLWFTVNVTVTASYIVSLAYTISGVF